MAVDRPCSLGCGRWGRVTSDVCEVCASNKSYHHRKRPALRMKYRQRLALAQRRQTVWAQEFNDPQQVEEIELDDPKKHKAKVIQIGPHLRRRKVIAGKRRKRA